MPILFKCECGAPGCVPDGSEGQEYTCQTCGHQGIVPSESSEDCVLVYKNGFPSEGVAMDVAVFQNELAEGHFAGTDLIFQDGGWKPLNFAYDFPQAPEAEVSAELGEDIALRFQQLPPMAGFEKLGGLHLSRKMSGGWAQFLEWKKRLLSLKYQSRSQKAVTVAVLLLLLVLIYVFGAGKLVNYALWKPVHVCVACPDAQSYRATLCGQSLDLPRESCCTFQDLFVSMGCSRKLVLTRPGDGGVAYSVSVPMRPGHSVVVNPGHVAFDIYEAEKQPDLGISSSSQNRLRDELFGNKAPGALLDILRKLQDNCRTCYRESRCDDCFLDRDFDLSLSGLVESADSSYWTVQHPEKAARRLAKLGSRPYAVRGARTFRKGELSLEYSPKKTYCPAEFVLVTSGEWAPDVPPAKADTLQVAPFGKGRLQLNVQVKGEELVLRVGGEPMNAKVVRDGKEYNGTWSYEATYGLSGARKGEWHWQWRYAGIFEPKKKYAKTRELHLKVDEAGVLTMK